MEVNDKKVILLGEKALLDAKIEGGLRVLLSFVKYLRFSFILSPIVRYRYCTLLQNIPIMFTFLTDSLYKKYYINLNRSFITAVLPTYEQAVGNSPPNIEQYSETPEQGNLRPRAAGAFLNNNLGTVPEFHFCFVAK